MKRLTAVWVSGQVPRKFFWNQRMIAIRRIIDYWRDIGEWWLDEPELWFWRVEGSDRGVYELAWNPEKNQWWLYHVYD
ncbi:MAG: DUF6504 family protein [Sulfobacillus sp.]|nr:DUF6504 family protein [Sulfobacillus sp.]